MTTHVLKLAGPFAAALALMGSPLLAQEPGQLPAGDTIETAGTDEPIPIAGFDERFIAIDNLHFFDGTAGPVRLALYSPEMGPLYVLDAETREELDVMGESWIFDRIATIRWTPSETAEDRPTIEVRAVYYVGAGPTAAQPFEVGFRIISKGPNYFDVEQIED